MKEIVVPAEEFKRRLIEKEAKKGTITITRDEPALVYDMKAIRERINKRPGGDEAA